MEVGSWKLEPNDEPAEEGEIEGEVGAEYEPANDRDVDDPPHGHQKKEHADEIRPPERRPRRRAAQEDEPRHQRDPRAPGESEVRKGENKEGGARER